MKGVGRAGAFVVLARGLEARVKLGNLADGFVAHPEQAFPEGKLVTGRVVSTDNGMCGALPPAMDTTLCADVQNCSRARLNVIPSFPFFIPHLF